MKVANSVARKAAQSAHWTAERMVELRAEWKAAGWVAMKAVYLVVLRVALKAELLVVESVEQMAGKTVDKMDRLLVDCLVVPWVVQKFVKWVVVTAEMMVD